MSGQLNLNASNIQSYLEQQPNSHIHVGIFDIDGVLRSKRLRKEKVIHGLKNNLGFCDVIFGWDCGDALYDNINFTGWHTGYPDAKVLLLPETCRAYPFEYGGLLILSEACAPVDQICPRGLLKRVLNRLENLGFKSIAALEYEFFCFNESPKSIMEKNFQHLEPMSTGSFGYSAIRAGVFSEFNNELIDVCEQSDIALEGLHTETGPGVLEAAICASDGLAAADKAALFKTLTKIAAQRHEIMATFMARWSTEYSGNGGHVHCSLTDLEGRPVFYNSEEDNNISRNMRLFIAGLQTVLPDCIAMLAPTVNSYARLVPGFWAPTSATWGVENRTCALRAITGSASSQRVECRIPGADANPYLVLAAVLAAGCYGMENKLQPSKALTGNAYKHDASPEQIFPETLGEAADKLSQSEVAKELFGNTFVEHFSATRKWEQRQANQAVSDWQLKRYFEII